MHINRVLLHPERYPRDCYPFNLDVLRKTESIIFPTLITFFIGENGTGKSTMLRAICQKCGIHIWEETERGRFQFNPYEDKLHNYIDVEWVNGCVPGAFFGSQIFQDYARFLDEWALASPRVLEYFGGSSLIKKSHGESIISYFTARYKIKGIYFLDEPETALSPKSQLRLLKLLKNISKAGHAQFIIATHSPLLLAYPGATIYSFNSVPINTILYEDTEYYQIYRDFLNHRSKYLDNL